jgi:hypothetical protein
MFEEFFIFEIRKTKGKKTVPKRRYRKKRREKGPLLSKSERKERKRKQMGE